MWASDVIAMASIGGVILFLIGLVLGLIINPGPGQHGAHSSKRGGECPQTRGRPARHSREHPQVQPRQYPHNHPGAARVAQTRDPRASGW